MKPDEFGRHRDDLRDWQRFAKGVNNVGSTREAMDFLELKFWRFAEIGAAEVEDLRGLPCVTSS